MGTNITEEHKEAMAAAERGELALFSCFVNGEPASALCAVTEEGGILAIQPKFVSVTPGMVITDHEGVRA